MTFSAEELRTAAKVARTHTGLTADTLEELAKRLDAKEEYAVSLGRMSWENRGFGFLYQGAAILSKLHEDGWTPPEGLF